MDVDQIIIKFREIYNEDFSVQYKEDQYIATENGLVEGAGYFKDQVFTKNDIQLGFSKNVKEDTGITFLLNLMVAYFDRQYYDRRYENLLKGTLEKDKAVDVIKAITGKRMDYLVVEDAIVDTASTLLEATFGSCPFVKDDYGMIVFMNDATDAQEIMDFVATVETELFVESQWLMGKAVVYMDDLKVQADYLRKGVGLLKSHNLQGSVWPMTYLLPYFFIDNGENKRALTHHLFKELLEIQLEEELIATVEMMFQKDLNLTETARALYIHRNTLLYRIDKIQKLTGFDLRKFSESFIFKIAWLIK